MAEGSPSVDRTDRVALLNDLGVALKFAGRYDEALQCYERASDLVIEHFGYRSDEMATILHNLGGLAHARHDHLTGIEHAREGLALRESLAAADSTAIGEDLAAYAALLEGAGQHALAEATYLRAGEILDDAHDWGRLAIVRNGLASVCQSLGRFDEARAHYAHAVELLQRAGQTRHPNMGQVLNNLGTLHRRLGNDEEARAVLTEAHLLLYEVLGREHPVTCEVEGNLRRVVRSASPYV